MDVGRWLQDTRNSYDPDADAYTDQVQGSLDANSYLRAGLALFAELVKDAGAGQVAGLGRSPGHVNHLLRALGVEAVRDRHLTRDGGHRMSRPSQHPLRSRLHDRPGRCRRIAPRRARVLVGHPRPGRRSAGRVRPFLAGEAAEARCSLGSTSATRRITGRRVIPDARSAAPATCALQPSSPDGSMTPDSRWPPNW